MTDTLVTAPDIAERMRVDLVQVVVANPSDTTTFHDCPPLWWVVVGFDGRKMILPHYTSHTSVRPTPEDVMRDLITAARSVENADSIQAWAGVDPDTKLDYRIEQRFFWCTDQTENLRVLLGDRYDEYLWQTKL